MKKWRTVSEITERAKMMENRLVRDLVSDKSLEKYYDKCNNKGWMGQAIESDTFELPNNSSKFADFKAVGVELKVTPIRKVKNGWSAKERLVLNIFDYNDEYKRQFEEASFLQKGELIQIVYYEYVAGDIAPNFKIKRTFLISIQNLPEKDLKIIKQDWELIVNMIKSGRAEELSDSLTKYLAATTKGSKTEKNQRTQPFSEAMAHQRSFTLKTKYMSYLANQIMSGNFEVEDYLTKHNEIVSIVKPLDIDNERVIKDDNDLDKFTFEENVQHYISKYVGKSKSELARAFNVIIPEENDKASTAQIVRMMLKLKTEITEVNEIYKSGISPRIVVVKSNQMKKDKKTRQTKEGFKLLSPINIVDESQLLWDESELYKYLFETQFLLFVFIDNGTDLIFKGIKFWSVPVVELDNEIRSVWEDTKKIINTGLTLKYKKWGSEQGYRIENNLAKISDDKIIHVRPDSSKASYKKSKRSVKLPVKSRWIGRPHDKETELTDYYITKQAFWFNPKYVYKQISDLAES